MEILQTSFLDRRPFIVDVLDKVSPLVLEAHRGDLIIARVDSEYGWTFGLLGLLLPT